MVARTAISALVAILAAAPGSARPPSLLSMFPGSTAKALASLADHTRIASWSFGIKEKRLAVQDFRLVIPAAGGDLKEGQHEEARVANLVVEDEEVLRVARLGANWSSYDAAPVVDLALADATVLVAFDGLVQGGRGYGVQLGSTNWSRLRRSGFPPRFEAAAPSPTSSPRTSSRTRFWRPATSDLLGDPPLASSSPSDGDDRPKRRRSLLGLVTPRLRKVECTGSCTVRFQATVWGQRVGAGLPAVVVPGALVTQLWNQAVAEWGGGDALAVDEAVEALTHVLLMVILDELAAASAGDQGPLVAAVREAVERLVKQALAQVDGRLCELLSGLAKDDGPGERPGSSSEV